MFRRLRVIRGLWLYRTKKQSDHTSNGKVKTVHKIIVVIEEEWFDDMNLTDGATFTMDLIKRAKNMVNQKIFFMRDTKWRIQGIAIKNGSNTQIFRYSMR